MFDSKTTLGKLTLEYLADASGMVAGSKKAAKSIEEVAKAAGKISDTASKDAERNMKRVVRTVEQAQKEVVSAVKVTSKQLDAMSAQTEATFAKSSATVRTSARKSADATKDFTTQVSKNADAMVKNARATITGTAEAVQKDFKAAAASVVIYHGEAKKASTEQLAAHYKQRDEAANGWKKVTEQSDASFQRAIKSSEAATKAVTKDFRAQAMAATIVWGDAYKATEATMNAHQARLAESGRNWKANSGLATDYFAKVSAAAQAAAKVTVPAIQAPVVAANGLSAYFLRAKAVMKEASLAIGDHAYGIRRSVGLMAADLFNDRAFAPKNFLKGLMSSIGIGSAVAIVGSGIDMLVAKYQEADVAAQKLVETNKLVEKSYQDLHKVLVNAAVEKSDPQKQVSVQSKEVERVRKQLEAAQTELGQIQNDRAKLGLRTLISPTAAKGLMGTADSFVEAWAAQTEAAQAQLKKDEELYKDAERIREKYKVTRFMGDDTALNMLESIKGEAEAKANQLKQELVAEEKKLADLTRKFEDLNKKAYELPYVHPQAIEQRQKVYSQEVSMLMKDLGATIGRQDDARRSTLEYTVAAAEQGRQLALNHDPVARYADEMRKMNEVFKTTFVDDYTQSQSRLALQLQLVEEQARKVREATQGAQERDRIKTEEISILQQSEFTTESSFTGGGELADRQKAIDMETTLLEESWKEQNEIAKKYGMERSKWFLQMEKNYLTRMQQQEQAKQEVMMASAMSIGESLVSIAKDVAGEQSGVYKAMFAVSKAFAIADAIVKIQQGIAAAAALPWPANLGAMASVAAATASIVSNIQAVRMASFLGGGETPDGPRTGGIDGQGGMMAILHPNEKVIDMEKDRVGGGSGDGKGDVNIVIENHTDATVTPQVRDDGSIALIVQKAVKQTKMEIAQEARSGNGPVSQAFEQTYKLRRV